LRRAFRSCDNQQPYIETVPKRGYKLVAPVDNIRPAEKDVTRNLRLPYLVWASSVIAVIVLATSYLGSRTEIMSNSNSHDGADVTNSTTALANQTVDNKTIAVLPFSDLSEYGDQQHLADGIADELLTALSRGKGVRVAPRRSAFAFRNQDHLDSRAVSDSLDVRYIIEGSVRAADDKILVTAMLTDSKIDQRIVVARNPA
jgi:TolB-like protein